MNERSDLGEEKVGEPLWVLRHAVHALALTEYEHARMDALDHYIEKFLMSFFPEVVDEALSDEQLMQLNPDTVKQIGFLLIGDAILQLRERLVPPETRQADPSWHCQLVQRIAKLSGLADGPLVEHVLSGKAQDEEDPLLAQLSGDLGVEVAKFFVVQPAMLEVVIEDVLGNQP